MRTRSLRRDIMIYIGTVIHRVVSRATHRGQAPLCPASGAQMGASPHVSRLRGERIARS